MFRESWLPVDTLCYSPTARPAGGKIAIGWQAAISPQASFL